MMNYIDYINGIVSRGLLIKDETTYTTLIHGVKRTITCARFTGNKSNRGFTSYFEHERSDLEECKRCSRFVRKVTAMNEMPWKKHFDRMLTEGGNEVRRFIDCFPFYMCRHCLSIFYKEMKVEFENAKTRETLKLLRKEIKCKSKQLEI